MPLWRYCSTSCCNHQTHFDLNISHVVYRTSIAKRPHMLVIIAHLATLNWVGCAGFPSLGLSQYPHLKKMIKIHTRTSMHRSKTHLDLPTIAVKICFSFLRCGRVMLMQSPCMVQKGHPHHQASEVANNHQILASMFQEVLHCWY